MQALVLAEKKTKSIDKIVSALQEEGFSKAQYLTLRKINLITVGRKTFIRNTGIDVNEFDVVFIKAGLQLAPFIEPLLDELTIRGIFSQIKKGSFYLNSNELYQLTEMNAKGVKVPKTVMGVSPDTVLPSVKELKFPVIFKAFSGEEKIQSMILNDQKSLESLIEGIKFKTDGIIVRELIPENVIECVVIGEDVFGIERQWNGEKLSKLSKGKVVKLSDEQKLQAIRAANVCGLEVATVKLCNGFVTNVKQDVKLSLFSKVSGHNLFKILAQFLFSKAKQVEKKPAAIDLKFLADVFKKFLREW